MNNVITANINVSNKYEAFETWLKLTKSLHNLTPEEIKVLAMFLSERNELQDKIIDEDLMNEHLFGTKIRKKIEAAMNYETTRLPNILSTMKKKGAIIDGKINPMFIPNISKDFNSYKIVFNVNIK